MRFLKLLLASIFVTVIFSLPASASTSDFVITNFHADYVLDPSIPGGGLETTETIDLNYNDYNHGILRAIPKKYFDLDTKLKVLSVSRDGQSEPYSTYTESDNLVLKIGDADRTITGEHHYVIRYSQIRVINFDAQKPEFYWDVNGDQWQQTFDHVSATVSIKGSKTFGDHKACYTGVVGSTNRFCSISAAGDSLTFNTSSPLGPFEGMTIAVSVDGAGFTAPVLSTFEILMQNTLFVIFYYIWPSILALFILLRVWAKYGKDYRGSGITVPEYEAPKNLSPAEVGMLADYNVDGKDLSATMIDLAVRGYLKIHEDAKKILFFSTKRYSLELLKIDTSQLKPHEETLIKMLFNLNFSKGEMVDLSDLRKSNPTMYLDVAKSKNHIKKSLTNKYGLIDQSGNKAFGWTVAGIVLFGVILAFLPDKGFMVNIIFFVILAIFFGSIMRRRTTAGQETYAKIMGLKMYMDVAEKDRLKMMQSVDRPYAEPSKTVELFEKLLPFAVALGVEKSWAKQFDGILTENPDWIASNNIAAFSGAQMASSLAGVSTNFSSSFQSSSGTSGSSGGGSSGGGGGGGGGGGW